VAYLNKYGVARKIRIPLLKAGSTNHAVSADWTPSAGDVKISKDGGAAANVTNLPTAIAMGNSTIWEFSLTATEMQAAQVNVTVGDSATKAVEDDGFDIETYGNASGQHAFDLNTATVQVASFSAGAITEAAYDTTAGAFQHLGIVDQGTAQGATGTTIQIRAAATFADTTLVGSTVFAFGSTQGYWQSRVVTANVGATDTCTVDTWTVTPSGTITYIIFGTPPNSSAGTVSADVTKWNGTAVSTPATAGIPEVNVKNINNSATSASGTITFPNATLASTTGAVGSVTGAVGSVTGAVGSVTGAVGSVTGNVGGNVVGSVASVTGNVGGNVVGSVASVTAGVTVTTNNDKTGYALTAGERTSVADALLDRDMSIGADNGSTTVRTVRQSLRFLRNKWSIAAGTLTVTKEDDVTSSWTAAVTQTAGDPVSAVDPAGP
jgi:hypothetical protein